MSENSICPLCNTVANFEICNGGNIYLYHCNTCTDYFISRSASTWINKHERHRKAHFSKVAASCKGKANILALTIVAGETLHPEEVTRDYYPKIQPFIVV